MPFMTYNSPATLFRHVKAHVTRFVVAARAEPNPDGSPEWYTGLVVSPSSFSRQLGDMQVSLLRANAPQPVARDPEETHLALGSRTT
jgi:hypothetical protein